MRITLRNRSILEGAVHLVETEYGFLPPLIAPESISTPIHFSSRNLGEMAQVHDISIPPRGMRNDLRS